MRVFILCAQRSGSMTFIEACKHITNYTCGHESRSTLVGNERVNYPDNHIEADNRLSFLLGKLGEKYGDNAIYIHLIRNREDTAKSCARRFFKRKSIVASYCESVLGFNPKALSKEQRLMVAADYYDTANANIQAFLRDKTNKMTVRLEDIRQDFKEFWRFIDAKGDLMSALATINKRHNTSKEMKSDHLYNLKLWLLRLKKRGLLWT